ncbi:CHASE2 domain-containing protein [Undibacterium danionis]|uniref:CHASE2 domain-containing protein n=1 Tax=Undibacterium danionis TaxID=1812100 RepID=A0ABV6IG86_9BURK
MKSSLRFIHVFTLVVALLAVFEVLSPSYLLNLDGKFSDWLVKLQAEKLSADPAIVILNIDDRSLTQMESKVGRWPWPRSVYAEVVEAILQQQPKAIVFDITFNERDLDRPESDQLFNQAIKDKRNIFFPFIRSELDRAAYVGKLSDLQNQLGLIKTSRANELANGAFLLPMVIDSRQWRIGTVNFLGDADGVGRRYELYTDISGWLVPSLPARVAKDLGYKVPQRSDLVLTWLGSSNPYQRISFTDLYADIDREKPARPEQEFKDKIVIIGANASSLHDLRVTPIDSQYWGSNILATAIDNLKNQQFISTPPPWFLLSATLTAIALIYTCFLRRVNALYPGLGLALITPMVIGGAYWALSQGILLHVLIPLFFVWIYYLCLALYEYWIVHRSYQATIKEFGRYVNPHVVKEWVAREGSEHVGEKAESREITVLFSDIRGFTSLSESRTPEQIVDLLNRYFTLQVEVIFRYNGTIDKFIGDCIMAFWGAPLDNKQHALDAVKAALEMSEVLEKFKLELGDLSADFDVGIGLHSGPAVVGSIGSSERKEFTAIGDTVNLASRIEGLTKGVSRILVSKETMLQCGDTLDFASFGSYKVKGREQEVELFSPSPRKLT